MKKSNNKKIIRKIIGRSILSKIIEKFWVSINNSDVSIILLKKKVNKIIWGKSAIKTEIRNFFIFKLKRIPNIFFIIKGIPGIKRNTT